MVVASLGGWGELAQAAFKTIALAAAARSGATESVEICYLYEGLSVKLQRANARALLSRVAAAKESSATALAVTSHSEAALVGQASSPGDSVEA